MPTHDLLLFAISFFVSYIVAFCFTGRQQSKGKTAKKKHNSEPPPPKH